MAEATEQEAKNIAIISYITLIGWIIAFVMNQKTQSSLGAFHIRQSLGIMIVAIVISIVANIVAFILYFIPVIGTILGLLVSFVPLAGLVLWILGLLAAINGEEKPVPFVGDLIQSNLKGIQ